MFCDQRGNRFGVSPSGVGDEQRVVRLAVITIILAFEQVSSAAKG